MRKFLISCDFCGKTADSASEAMTEWLTARDQYGFALDICDECIPVKKIKVVIPA